MDTMDRMRVREKGRKRVAGELHGRPDGGEGGGEAGVGKGNMLENWKSRS